MYFDDLTLFMSFNIAKIYLNMQNGSHFYSVEVFTGKSKIFQNVDMRRPQKSPVKNGQLKYVTGNPCISLKMNGKHK